MNEENEEVFKVEIEDEIRLVYKKPAEDGILWNISSDDYYILKRDGVYQANIPSDYYEYDSLSEAWLKIRSHIKQDIQQDKIS